MHNYLSIIIILINIQINMYLTDYNALMINLHTTVGSLRPKTIQKKWNHDKPWGIKIYIFSLTDRTQKAFYCDALFVMLASRCLHGSCAVLSCCSSSDWCKMSAGHPFYSPVITQRDRAEYGVICVVRFDCCVSHIQCWGQKNYWSFWLTSGVSQSSLLPLIRLPMVIWK